MEKLYLPLGLGEAVNALCFVFFFKKNPLSKLCLKGRKRDRCVINLIAVMLRFIRALHLYA